MSSNKDSLKTNSLKDDIALLNLKLQDAILRISILESQIDSLRDMSYHKQENKLPPLVIKQ